METSSIIKWGLILVAGYLVYKYLSESGMFGGIVQPAVTDGTTATAGTGTAPGTTTQSTTKIETKPESKPTGYVVIDPSALSNYAKTRMGPDWEGLLTISQWNWMVSQMTGTNQQADLSFGESVPDPITVADYIARRVRAGLSGLESGKGIGEPSGFPAYYNAWTV